MKYLRTIIVLLILCVSLSAEDFVVTSNEYIVVSGNVGDSLGRTRLTPDSVRIVITDSAGTELHDAWYEAADAQAVLNGNVITFTDQWNDINGAASIGIFTMTVTIGSDAQNNLDLFSNYEYTIRGVTVGVEQTHNELAELLDSIQNHDNWVAQQAAFDSLKYRGRRGPGIWLDLNAANTNTVVGTDGLENNPVSTLAAARTIADALGIKRYYLANRSTFEGANDLTATHEEWEFIGVGAEVSLELDAAGVDVDGSYFESLKLLGMQGGTGDIEIWDGLIGRLDGANGHFQECGLTDTIFIDASEDLFLDDCHSEIPGNGRPGISFGNGIVGLSVRNYSGGLEIRNMDGNDNASIEADGQVVVNANCSNANITLRGMMTITDNGSSTTLTRDAVFSRQESGGWVGDTVWGKDFADAIATAGSMGDSLGTQAYIQGAASGLSATEIADTINNRGDVSMSAATVENGAITAASITNESITALKFADNAITSDILAPNSIGASEIATDAIGSLELASSAAIEIKDTIYNADTATNNATVGSYGEILSKPAYVQGAASGLDSAIVQGAVIAAFNADTTAKFKQIAIRATVTDDTALIVTGNGSGIGLYVEGGSTGTGMEVQGNAGMGFFANSASTIAFRASTGSGANPTVLFENDGTGEAVKITSAANDAVEIEAEGSLGHAVFIHSADTAATFFISNTSNGATGVALDIRSDTAAGVLIRGGNIDNYALEVEGTTYLHTLDNDTSLAGTALQIQGAGNASAINAFSASGKTVRISKTGSGDISGDTTLAISGSLALTGDILMDDLTIADLLSVGGNLAITGNLSGDSLAMKTEDVTASVSGADMQEIADSVDRKQTTDHGSGAWTSGSAGSGTDTLRMYAFDTTTAVNAVVEDATVTAVSPGNVVVAQLTTNASGFVDFLLDAATDYTISAVGPPGNYWNSGITVTNDAGLDQDTITGFTLSSSVPSATQVCNVSVVVRKNNGDPHEGIYVTAMLTKPNIVDSAGFAISNIAVRAKTDATGTAVLTLRWSSYLIPATPWRLTVGIPGGVKCTYTVPRETTQTIDLNGDCD